MATQNNTNDNMVISYMALRKAVGFLGFLLPFVLVAVSRILGNCTELQGSISHYYYTIAGTYFVGTLCAIALFMFSYKGYNNSKQDRIASFLAAVFALVVAFCPTDPDPAAPCLYVMLNGARSVTSIHYTAAALLFLTLAYFCLFLFTKSSHPGHTTGRKQIRNGVYMVCGVLILLCMVLIGVYHFADDLETKLAVYKPVFFLETIALMAFGISWIVKGEAVLKDI